MFISYLDLVESFQQPKINTNGFTAYKTSNQNYNDGELIEFEGITSNIGSSYSPNYSQYVCPVNGTYLVILTFWKYGKYPIHAGVQKSSVIILHIEDPGSENNNLNRVSNSRLFHCTVGEIVSVQATGFGSIFGTTSNSYSTFTVLLLPSPGKNCI